MRDAPPTPVADDRLARHEAFLRLHVLPRLKGWRLRENCLHRHPIGDFLCSLRIDLDEADHVVGWAEAEALFADGMSAGMKRWQPRARKLEARVKVIERLVARAEAFFRPYATPERAARWFQANPRVDPMEGQLTALTWALAGRPKEALAALSRAIAFGDMLTEPHVRDFNQPILDDLAALRRDLLVRPAKLQAVLRKKVRSQIASYRKSGLL